jgi:ATP synthase protein I
MKNRWNKDVYRNFALITQLGVQMVAPILLCLALGVWLDEKYGTWFTLPLIILGVLGGGKSAYTLAMKSSQEDAKEQQKREEERKLVEEAMEHWNRGREYGGGRSDHTGRK